MIGRPVADAVHAIGVTEVTYYRWRKRYHDLNVDQVEWLKSKLRTLSFAARCES